jgi:hypothetical protein
VEPSALVAFVVRASAIWIAYRTLEKPLAIRWAIIRASPREPFAAVSAVFAPARSMSAVA